MRRNRDAIFTVIVLFFLIQVVFRFAQSTNPASRLAALCAMTEDHTFKIDNYYQWTIDWAQTPDGHYYSNKAPGPVLLALPLFYVVDSALTWTCPNRLARDHLRWEFGEVLLFVVSFFLQIVPICLLSFTLSCWLAQREVSSTANEIGLFAILFGNTAAIFMSTFFGHGFAAVSVLALCYCVLTDRYVACGLAFGMALLSDYAAAVFLAPIIVTIVCRRRGRSPFRALAEFVLGGIGPGLLWMLYHVSCFGGMMALPNKYQNPLFVDAQTRPIWGVIGLIPDMDVAVGLVVGYERGILWTQPWVILLVFTSLVISLRHSSIPARRKEEIRSLTMILIPSLTMLIWMNASFNGWHGGWCPGPRYLSLIFPSFGLLLALQFDVLARVLQLQVSLLVGFSVLLFVVVFATTLLAPPGVGLWDFYLSLFATKNTRHIVRALLLLGLLGIPFCRTCARLAHHPLSDPVAVNKA